MFVLCWLCVLATVIVLPKRHVIVVGVVATIGIPNENEERQRPRVDVSAFKWPSLSRPAPAVSYAQEGINFYLRLGAIGK